MSEPTTERKEYQLAGGLDSELVEYLKERLKVFHDLELEVVYNEYFRKYYLSGTLPANHSPDYILGLVDGTVHEYKRMK